MNILEKNIIFGEIQRKKGNSSKKIRYELKKNLRNLKSITQDDDFNSAFDYIFKNKSVRENHITANLFPRETNILGKYLEADFTDDIRLELRWQCKLFSKYVDEINRFILLKEKFDELILEGRYRNALSYLEDVEKEFGVSLWILENKILLYRKLDLNVKKEILDKTKSGFVSSILGFYDMKVSDKILSREYQYTVKREISIFKRINPDSESIIDCYSYFIAPFLFEMTTSTIIHLLKYIHKFPLIDRYLTVIDIIKHYVSMVPEEVPDWLNMTLAYLSNISDSNVKTCRFIVANKDDKLTKFVVEDDLVCIKNKFLLGELEECYELVRKKIENEPVNIKLYNLYVELRNICGYKAKDLNVCESKEKIISSLNDIYCFTDEFSDSIDMMYKLCFLSFQATWSKDLYNEIIKNIKPLNSKKQKMAIKYSNFQKLTVETIMENILKHEAIYFLENISLQGCEDYRFYCLLLLKCNFSEASEICKVTQLSELLYLQEKKTFSNFEKYLKGNNPTFYNIKCTKFMWDSMKSNDDFEKGIDYFIHLFLKREEYATIAPINKFMRYASTCKSIERKNIRLPILYYIYTTYFDSSKKEDLSIVCEDFFYFNDVEKPSGMKDDSLNYNMEQLIFFLRYVCVPQVMGPVLLTIRTSNELEEERIYICQKLREIDPKNEDKYDQEIKDITHKLFLNDNVSDLETHKIQVNTDGIKNRISKELKILFNKYIYIRNSELSPLLEKLKSIEGFEEIRLLPFQPSQILNEIVTTIRNEFVSGAEYGLDSYLSLNIRHGTLTGQLRAPLSNKNLLAVKTIETGEYKVHKKWLYKLREESDIEKAKEAIIRFTEKTDEIIDYLKKELIHISTEEKPTNGVFDYSLTEKQINFFQSYLTETSEIEDFIDTVFIVLWDRTELNLERMRKEIKENVKQQYIDAFEELQKAYKNLKVEFTEANQWIKETQNEMDAELEKICDWFRRSLDGQDPDFHLDSAFDVGLQTIKNIHPSIKFNVICREKELTEKIPGYAWKYFVSIFNILFDNISKYAKKNGDEIHKVDYILKSNKSRIFIRMQNMLDEGNDLDEAKKKVKYAMDLIRDTSYLSRVKQEGGSGIPKIYKMLAIDLKLKPRVECTISNDKKIFCVEIEVIKV